MTAYERGDVIEASDPFTERNPSRPFLIVNSTAHPFSPEQYVALTLTTKTWHSETLPLPADAFIEGSVPDQSFIVPWGVVSPAHDDIDDWFGRVEQETVDRAVDQLYNYLTESGTHD
ncbi:type II toxin-antitoxin system PemK/MazF family toxin [Halorarum salinum]|uniref:Type II toxin-antitoxin system PemK/MazF family toxin n=1 Tax=Halorarum salinum TaxID=2743089 RepID=A0A7D5QAL7_9EURY|nr:type II toxin-antitoxin system PemK/MazF family toxin [Halobaculum salinum]QLG61080.1 type II toxin-antitoxin system PemK/MazF family toxin [Halobaculum salinum]